MYYILVEDPKSSVSASAARTRIMHIHQMNSLYPSCQRVDLVSSCECEDSAPHRATRTAESLSRSISSCFASWEHSPTQHHMQRAKKRNKREKTIVKIGDVGEEIEWLGGQGTQDLASPSGSSGIQDEIKSLRRHGSLERGILRTSVNTPVAAL